MMHTFTRLIDQPLQAIDGEIGVVTDVYFFDVSWFVEFVAVEAGKGKSGKLVLVSTNKLRTDAEGRLHTILSRDEVLSRSETDMRIPDGEDANGKCPRLLGSSRMFTYTLVDSATKFGTISDFAFNPEQWVVEKVIALDRSAAIPRVLIVPVSSVKSISHADSAMHIKDGSL